MRRVAFLTALAFTLASFIALNGAAASYAGAPASKSLATTQGSPGVPAPLCEKDSPRLCWRDPSTAVQAPR